MKVRYWLLGLAVAGTLTSVSLGSLTFLKIEHRRQQQKLGMAAQRGDIEGLRAALRSGAKVNGVVREGRTAIFWAASREQVDAIRFLAAHGANVNQSDLSSAYPLTLAVTLGKAKSVKALLEHGAFPNVANSKGYTPLQLATAKGNLEIVELLVAANANPGLTWNGPSAMELARDKPAILKVFRKHGRSGKR